jgi:hypothetical protein
MKTDIIELTKVLVSCSIKTANAPFKGILFGLLKMFPRIPTNALLAPFNYFGGRTLRDRVAVIG